MRFSQNGAQFQIVAVRSFAVKILDQFWIGPLFRTFRTLFGIRMFSLLKFLETCIQVKVDFSNLKGTTSNFCNLQSLQKISNLLKCFFGSLKVSPVNEGLLSGLR